jgi:hypothetical protein
MVSYKHTNFKVDGSNLVAVKKCGDCISQQEYKFYFILLKYLNII